MKLNIPDILYNVIKSYFRYATEYRDLQHIWEINHQEEDSLTGAVFVAFATKRVKKINVDGNEWTWKVRFTKFRSRGYGAEEKRWGADGIVEIEVEDISSGYIDRKSLLIQAKKQWNGPDSRLLQQIEKMEKISEKCSALFNYSPQGFFAVESYKVISSKGFKPNNMNSIGAFLSEQFLACHIGKRGLFYDSTSKKLILPQSDSQNAPDAIRNFDIPQRLRIEVKKCSHRKENEI